MASTKGPQRKSPPRRSPRLAVLDQHPLAVPPTAAASPTAASSNKRSIEEVRGSGSSGGGDGGNRSGDPAAIPEAKAYSVTRSGKRSRQQDIGNNGSVGRQVAAAATAAGAKSSATRLGKRNSHGPGEENNSNSGQSQVTDVAATAVGFNTATAGFKKTSAATSSSLDDECDKDSSGQPVFEAAGPVVKAPVARNPSVKISPDVDEESNTGSCCEEVLPSGGANASVAASGGEPQVAVAAPAAASASATTSGERNISPGIDTGNEDVGQEQVVAAAPAVLAPKTSSGVRSSSQDCREKDSDGEEVLEAAEAEVMPTSSRKSSIPDATKRASNSSTITTDTSTISPHMAILRQVQADLCEAVYRCEELLGNMEEDLLRRQPNAMSVPSVAQGSSAPVPSPSPSPPSSPSSSLGALEPSRAIALHLKEARPVRKVEPRERIFSQSSQTSVFWRVGAAESKGPRAASSRTGCPRSLWWWWW
ncbi:unnamed protein product [Ectocarpus fasciculatus]